MSPTARSNAVGRVLCRRDEYRQVLADAQGGSMDVTSWMVWFLDHLTAAMSLAHGASGPPA